MKKGGTTQMLLFSDALKNSSTAAEWREHEVRFAKTIEAIAQISSKFEELKFKGKDYEPSIYELGSLYQEYCKSIEGINNECDSCIHLLKDKYQSERRKVLRCQTSGLEQLYKECSTMFSKLKGCETVLSNLKDKGQFLRYCKLSDQFNDARVKIQDEIVKTDSLFAQGARSTKVKSALPKVREMKDEMDKTLKEQRTLMNLHFGNREFFAPKEAILAEVERELQKATIEWIGYVDPDSKDTNTTSENLAAKDATIAEERSETHNISTNPETDLSKRKKSAVEKMDQSLKLLKSFNDTISRDESSKYEESSTKYEAPAHVSQQLKPSTSNFPSTMKSAGSEPWKYQHSNTGSRSSRLSERRRLESRAKLLEQESRMAIEKKERELELKRKQRQLEMEIKLEEMQAETELADLRDQTSLKMQEMKLQIEEAEGSCNGSTVSPSLMSISIDADKNSDIKSWLDQNSDVVDIQKQNLQNVVQTAKGNTVISSDPVASRTCRGKPLKVIERKDPSTNRKGGRVSDRGDRSQSRSKSRTFSPKRHLNVNCKVPNRVSQLDSLPFQQPVLPQWTVQASSLPKLKMTEFAGDPLEWPEWSSLFNAVIHNAPIDDNAKMRYLKTLVKGKAKAAIAGLGYSGALYHTAWDTLVRNFGRPQTVVNAQMKLIHTYPFIKSHDSAAIIKYAQLITTCVSILNQYGYTGDLSSESVLNSAVRKLPPELKTKWLFFAKGQNYQTANFSKFSEWLNNIAFVHDELLAQFRQSNDKKQSTSADRTKTTGSSMSAAANETGLSTFNSNPKSPNKCVVCGNTHGLWACDAFKKLPSIDRYKKVKENKLCFLCFRGGHAVKDCKMKECGIDGCKRRHNRLLHRPEETKIPNTTSTEIVETHASVSLNTFGILPVYKVELSNNGNRMKLLALVDSGSSLSWIDKTVADQLNLQGVKRSLTVSGINGTECHDSEIVNVTIHSKDYGNEDVQMAIHQKLVIGESFYDIRKLQCQYPQLTKVPSNNFNLKDVRVILGTDCFSLTRPLEYQRGQPGEPWAVRCSLGFLWGLVNGQSVDHCHKRLCPH